MENLLFKLKNDFKYMLELQREISELNTKLLYKNDLNDKRNYSADISARISDKSRILNNRLFELKVKWGI